MCRKADAYLTGQYQLLLTQAPNGARAFVLHSLKDALPDTAILHDCTEQTQHGLLLSQSLHETAPIRKLDQWQVVLHGSAWDLV